MLKALAFIDAILLKAKWACSMLPVFLMDASFGLKSFASCVLRIEDARFLLVLPI